VNRGTRIFVQTELSSYEETKKDLEELKAEIAETRAIDTAEERRGSSIGNPTENKAASIITNKRLRRMEETIRAIEVVFNSLPPEKKRLVKMKYWDRRYTDFGIANELFISDRTFRRWNRNIITSIAKEMGLVE